MLKTYIRINNFYLIKDKNKYFLSSCSDPKEWKKLKKKDLDEYKTRDVTTKLRKLKKKYGSEKRINYITSTNKKTKKKSKKKTKKLIRRTLKGGG